MEKNSKIYVAGHRGMVGSAIVRELRRQGYDNIITRTHAELDLTRQSDVESFFAQERPEYVFLAAAKVGGIVANDTAPADFMYENMMLGMNVIHSAWRNGCRKLEFLGSSCIYPRLAPQPMREDCLLTGPLERTNEAYALAKIAGLKYCEYLNRQYGTDFIGLSTANILTVSTARTSSALCRRTCTVPMTTTTRSTATSFRPSSAGSTRPRSMVCRT